MKLPRRALSFILPLLCILSAGTTQAQSPSNSTPTECRVSHPAPDLPEDPRNLSPTVGTGGPVAGPTGLFTAYDGQILRRREFTFSISYSKFDCDPGDVALNEVPLSFNVGLSDHLELFFNTTAWRGLRVNTPQNLSSFYLPNSQLKFPGLGSSPAIVLAPTQSSLVTFQGAVFRPRFNQPFVQYSYVGGSAGTFGLNAGGINGNKGRPRWL